MTTIEQDKKMMIYLAYVEYARYLLPPHRELSPQEKHKHHQGLYKLNLKRCVQHETIPGHKEAMCCSKNMYFINQDTRTPGVVIWVLDHHLPGVELGLGTGATHDVVVQSGLLLVTTYKNALSCIKYIFIFTVAHKQV